MVPPTVNEMALLQDVKLRRTSLKNRPLVIKNRVFDNSVRFQDFELEDTEFVNCDFLNCLMLDGILTNVRFINCLFFANRWTDGAWTNVQFKDCAWRGPFNMGPTIGEGTLRFDACEFVGSTLEELGYGGKADYFGSIGGTMGDVVYENSKFQRVFINGGKSLRISKCNFDDVVVDAQDDSEILLEDIEGRELLDLGSHSVFAKVHVRRCVFNGPVTLSDAKMELGIFEDVVATLNFSRVKAKRIDLRRVSFKGTAKPDNIYLYGLITQSAKIDNFVIEDCAFVENGGALNLQGDLDDRPNSTEKRETSRPSNLYSTVIGNLLIRNTPVKNGRFDYVEAKEVIFDNLALAGANFSHAKIDRLKFRDVKMSGKIELTEAHIGEKIVERVVDTSDWNSARQVSVERGN